ncbi:hypothetical protein [uncultured Pseudomonas sp.]|uniref:hypothetical protein n=1 Tax=uncultured Pseudomonas sp. TaxID=114707 RepID=UPI0025864EBF|nr:hypothetical protein [uncultured Pseudomonas sp.]
MGRDGRDTVYCNIQMPLAKGRDLVRLATELRASGTHPDLESVFEEIQGELEMSIEFVEEMLTGGSVDQHRH